MPINPKGLVDFAFDLYQKNVSTNHQILNNYKTNSNEIEFRTVVNRAYYGAFLTAQSFCGIKNSSGSVHSEVIGKLRQNKDHQKAGNILDALKRRRQKADYEPDQEISERDAKTSCREAKSIIEHLESLSES